MTQKILPQDVQQAVANVAESLQTSPEEVVSMLEAIERGESRAEYFGFTDEVLRGIEAIALAYYRSQRYRDADVIFSMMATLTDGSWAAASRGMGACAQAQGQFGAAIEHFRRALAVHDNDVHSAIYLGECLCLSGNNEEGLRVLREVLKRHEGGRWPKDASHLLRAKAIVQAGGVTHAQLQKKPPRHNEAGVQQPQDASPMLEAAADDAVEAILQGLTKQPEVQDAKVQAMLSDPAIKAQLDEIALAVQKGALTIRQLADFSAEQMDAGYAVACQMLERGEPQKALQLAGWMLYIDARDTRFYRLAGLCMHQQKIYSMADYFYTLVNIWRPGGADAATLMYHGEAKLMLDEREEGLSMLQRGVAQAESDATLKEVVKRGRALLKQLEQRPT